MEACCSPQGRIKTHTTMRTTILNKLKEIEGKENIRILYACESGSRGWQFPSPDSDYDVRFIYIRPAAHYLAIRPGADTLGFPINEELDINGWDLQKTLRLTCQSNTTPFEWLQSPEIYREEPGFRDGLWALCTQYFSRRGNIMHYLGIARGAASAIGEDGALPVKKLFYILRPLLAASWCLAHNAIAPMSIEPLMSLLPESLKEKVIALIRLKAGLAEQYRISLDIELAAWIDDTQLTCMEAARQLEHDHFSPDTLDRFFRETINCYDHKRTKG